MKKLITGILVVAMLMSSMSVFAGEPEIFEYYDADNDRNCIEYYYGDTEGELYDTFSYYDADNDIYVTEYYYGDDSDDYDETDYECEECPDYCDQYYDEYPVGWYSPVTLNDWADFYSLDGEYICSMPEGTWVQPMEIIGRSGDITYIMYNGYKGYVYTTLLLHPPYYVYDPTYDELYQSGDGYYENCYEGFGYATIIPSIGANVRDCKNNVITAVPCGEEVMLLESLNYGGRTLIKWGGYVGTVLSSTLKV